MRKAAGKYRLYPLLAFVLLLTAGAGAQQRQNFEVEKLAEGVFAVVRREPPGLMFDANNVFIVGEREVVVVDSNFSHASTREVLAALRKITDKPVAYVVNTHWHDDHITGNQIYREAFPGVRFIGHESAAADMSAAGAKNRKSLQENAPNLVKLFRSQIEKKKSLAGGELSDEERESYSKDARLIENYAASVSSLEIIAPTLAVKDKLVLRQGARKIEILHLGRGHTPADLVVRLPAEGILITGDLIVHPVPLVGSTSLPADYAATLERLLELKPKLIVPGHGTVMRDTGYVRQTIELLNSINRQTQAAVRRGESLEETRKSVDLEQFRQRFAGGSQNKRFIFQTYVAQPGVEAAYRQAAAAAEKSKDKQSMVLIPGATFEMGTNEADIPKLQEIFKIGRAELFADETPRRPVRVDSFYLDKYEVTNADFKKILDRSPAWRKDKIAAEFHNGKYLLDWEGGDFPAGKARHPVVYVSWHAAVAFCRSLGKRLPTEAEWEYAARGGLAGKQFPWGDEAADKTRANFGASGIGAPVAVGSYPANGYGLFDMAGNVWEFLADEWQKYPSPQQQGAEIQVNPVAGGDIFSGDSYRQVKTRRVIRGGSYGGAPVNLRVTYRDSHLPANAGDHVGFRCAQNASAKKIG